MSPSPSHSLPIHPVRLNTASQPPEPGVAGIAALPKLQQADGQGRMLTVMPAALLTSGTTYLNHTLATK